MIKELSINISATAVAWYGAILATISFIYSAYSVWRDKARIKIEFKKDVQVMNMPLYDSKNKYINISVINRGRRPIRIEKALLKMVNAKGFSLLSDSFVEHRRKILTEEHPCSDFLCLQDDINPDKIWYILVIDGTGKKYIKYLDFFGSLEHLLFLIKNIYEKK
ncbi:MAG: hypothetical protein COT24_00170 [Candidatus Kerfeldbacteria bacterium CG08_land_8_20_14_0_20_40_16]|uniref:Uncharacterized protein n=1 Tax=Candidatus Kerfeldbacteria bacterium CG08_land_8_20_14_0_20_40_16 TaxID=2014244 RepID=A0A2H0YX39_9BACT|nr:MAG: hypothetical protein COT24_00170 [Candidatus Kerfeldbacteria bacterium CG08_land_8_20_14_0_20_40_16]